MIFHDGAVTHLFESLENGRCLGDAPAGRTYPSGDEESDAAPNRSDRQTAFVPCGKRELAPRGVQVAWAVGAYCTPNPFRPTLS